MATLRRAIQLFLCGIAALLITLLAGKLDEIRTRSALTRQELNFARQIASEAEGLSLAAREKGIPDPLGWSTDQLSQGIEPRMMRVQKLEPGQKEPEAYDLDLQAGIFEYRKILAPETGEGVHVLLRCGYRGFLGTQNRFTSDFSVAIFYSLICSILLFLSSYLFVSGEPSARRYVSVWTIDARSHLAKLGVHIREMIREAQKLAAGSAQSRKIIGELRDGIQSQSGALEETKSSLKAMDSNLARMEALLLSSVIEANRLGTPAKTLIEMTEELHQLAQKLRGTASQATRNFASLESKLAPWHSRADSAFQIHSEVFQISDSMNDEITETTQAIRAHNQAIHELSENAGVHGQKIPPPPKLEPVSNG